MRQVTARVGRWCGLCIVAIGLASGCGAVTVQIPIDLGTAGEFEVEAGVPVTKTLQTTFSTRGLTVGGGSVELDPSAVTVDEATAKVLQAGVCGAACTAAGVAESVCDLVCVEGNLIVSIAIGALDEINTVCTSGDQYGPYTVEIDAQGNGVSVSPSTVTLQADTIAALNAGEASFCLEVISPVTGAVVVGEVILNAGL